jgi:hypothetical protein
MISMNMICENCGNTNNVIDFYIGDQEHVLCMDCRIKLLGGAPRNIGARQPGRPSLGVTKKVSLTLPEETWEWFDEKAAGNRSELIRYLIGHERSPEREWSNNACLGYAIFGAHKLGYSEEQIKELVRAIYGEFDWKSVEEAKVVYNQSSY